MDQDTLQHAPTAVSTGIPATDTGSDSVVASIADGAENLLGDIADALPDVPEALLLGEHGGVIILTGLIIATIVLLALSAATGAL